MARKFKKSKVSICVFCEGESEQAYIDFLKSEFHATLQTSRAFFADGPG